MGRLKKPTAIEYFKAWIKEFERHREDCEGADYAIFAAGIEWGRKNPELPEFEDDEAEAA